jgi:hypothetical protein
MRTCGSALRYWAASFRLRHRAALPLPIPVSAVLQFLVDHMEHTTEDGTLAHDLPVATEGCDPH